MNGRGWARARSRRRYWYHLAARLLPWLLLAAFAVVVGRAVVAVCCG